VRTPGCCCFTPCFGTGRCTLPYTKWQQSCKRSRRSCWRQKHGSLLRRMIWEHVLRRIPACYCGKPRYSLQRTLSLQPSLRAWRRHERAALMRRTRHRGGTTKRMRQVSALLCAAFWNLACTNDLQNAPRMICNVLSFAFSPTHRCKRTSWYFFAVSDSLGTG